MNTIDPRDRPRLFMQSPPLSVTAPVLVTTDHEDARCPMGCNTRTAGGRICRGCERDMAESYREARRGY